MARLLVHNMAEKSDGVSKSKIHHTGQKRQEERSRIGQDDSNDLFPYSRTLQKCGQYLQIIIIAFLCLKVFVQPFIE